MQFIEQTVVHNSVCAAKYGPLPYNNMCVSTPDNKSPCKGDAGGPLVMDSNSVLGPMLLGVLSAGSQECERGFPVIYTRITSYLDWIRDHSGVAWYE